MQELWIDVPPPERDPELGIGRYVAWRTPLHREAVRRAIEEYKAGEHTSNRSIAKHGLSLVV